MIDTRDGSIGLHFEHHDIVVSERYPSVTLP
jgi:hypothetical protein